MLSFTNWFLGGKEGADNVAFTNFMRISVTDVVFGLRTDMVVFHVEHAVELELSVFVIGQLACFHQSKEASCRRPRRIGRV